MRLLDPRQVAVCTELVVSGAMAVIVEQMAVRIITESLDNDTMRDDRETRAKLALIKSFDRQVQSIINSTVEM